MLYSEKEAAGLRRAPTMAGLVRNMSYEVMPFKKTEQDVVENVPTEVPLTVTVTEAKGIDTTLALTERLVGHGYRVSPHLPARQFVDDEHVADVVARLCDGGVNSVFVIGGDAPQPAGKFVDALGLLRSIGETGHRFDQVGIGGYPEGHATIVQSDLEHALEQKARHAGRVLTQICFDAPTIGTWATEIRSKGVELPVYVGMPGPVNRQKLVRISAGIGLGQSARFLQKQQSLIWKFFLPGAYNPTRLVRRLAAVAPKTDNNIAGLHIFTFNELRRTEEWRQQLLAAIDRNDRR